MVTLSKYLLFSIRLHSRDIYYSNISQRFTFSFSASCVPQFKPRVVVLSGICLSPSWLPVLQLWMGFSLPENRFWFVLVQSSKLALSKHKSMNKINFQSLCSNYTDCRRYPCHCRVLHWRRKSEQWKIAFCFCWRNRCCDNDCFRGNKKAQKDL